MTLQWYIERLDGVIISTSRWPRLDTEGVVLPVQERLAEDHPEVVSFFYQHEFPEASDPHADLLEALNEFVTNGTRSKLDELLDAKALEQQT